MNTTFFRPACPLPYRPLSAGPILHRHYHHHSSLRQLGGSQSRLTPTKTVGTNTPTRFNPLNQSTSSAPAGSKTEETTDAGNAQGGTGGGSADGGGGSTVNNIEKKVILLISSSRHLTHLNLIGFQ